MDADAKCPRCGDSGPMTAGSRCPACADVHQRSVKAFVVLAVLTIVVIAFVVALALSNARFWGPPGL